MTGFLGGEPGLSRTGAVVPVHVFGSVRMVSVEVDGSALADARRVEEEARRTQIGLQRAYYHGRQYDQLNGRTALELELDTRYDRLPEHDRRHEYSTQIQECVDYLADRIGDGWAVESDDARVQQILAAVVETSPQIASVDENGAVVWATDDPLRDAMISGDVPAYVGVNPITGLPFVQLWEAEVVSFETNTTDAVERVVREELVWLNTGPDQVRQVRQRIVYDMAVNPEVSALAGRDVLDCRVREFWDDGPDPVRPPEFLNLGRIPWQLLRATTKGLRAVRGESLITDQVMKTADRLNAVEQTGYLVARYNSHGNAIVIGDAAFLEANATGRVQRDVADVMVYPGATDVKTIELPTDMGPTEHQTQVLTDSLYALFGLVRLDPGTIATYGNVTGYALEILNQKTETTFRRIRRTWRNDHDQLVDLILDVAAWRNLSREQLSQVTGDGVLVPMPADPAELPTLPTVARWWDVNPRAVYPNRKLQIRMGSGAITDDVKGRDDFIAGLTDQWYELEQRGLDEPTIRDIQRRQLERRREESQADTGGELPDPGQNPPDPARTTPGQVPPSPSSIGSTVADVTRRSA